MNLLEQINKAEQEGIPFAAYKNPNENSLTLILQHTDDLFVFDDFTASGYVFAPFDSKEDAYILKPDRVYKESLASLELISDTDIDVRTDDVAKNSHMTKVAEAVASIQSTDLSKIVISRKEELSVPNFDTITVFEKLLNTYANAYVYIWYHPRVGKWMGATPETLLKVEQGVFKTMSLAGTQAFKGDLNPTWGAKELEEQQMVSDFIKSSLETKVDDLQFSEVKTVKAGTLLHLKTNVSGRLKQAKDVEVLVHLLHPTPAVCGLPKNDSKSYILKNEGYHRSFYTGYLGVLNMFKQTSLFVNLRCFSVNKETVSLYVGGGITSNSHPEKEWLETVAKSKTIKRVLF
ncbi:chorismate-binding protein [Wenyingzhuangia aestuarii]|uniref:chorismate-binding protein n=1 Tax=Wenyingzhuangia aestuarii TaxID=1647582 RepID=UPI0014391657|nr:chorismate-binding protein [Wenyingzhuangia aestuarii]NJB83812.1 isochorismate synthase [Wenyingzhuangia aestuarii]